jgi:hypothetical protein
MENAGTVSTAKKTGSDNGERKTKINDDPLIVGFVKTIHKVIALPPLNGKKLIQRGWYFIRLQEELLSVKHVPHGPKGQKLQIKYWLITNTRNGCPMQLATVFTWTT